MDDSTMHDAANEFAPSNGAQWSDVAGALAPTLQLNGATIIDADTGAISGAQTRAPNQTPTNLEVIDGIGFRQVGDVGILAVQQLKVAGKITVVGQHALLILANDTVVVEASGSINVAKLDIARPRLGRGGFYITNGQVNASGCGPGQTAGGNNSGGGGGGFGANGGAGGSSMNGVGGILCNKALHERLLFGSGGGAAKNADPSRSLDCGGPGGDSGGALQISARNSITLNGELLANGHGGLKATIDNAGCGGGGGGSGGGILLEAPAISGTGSVYANGGAGASSLENGTDGNASLIAAPGGRDNGMDKGGSGGTRMAAAGNGITGNGGGGGGGAVGKIEFRTRSVPSNLAASPAIDYVQLP